MKDSTKSKIERKTHVSRGAATEKLRSATNGADLKTEGTGEKIAGKIRKTVGDIEMVMEKLARFARVPQ